MLDIKVLIMKLLNRTPQWESPVDITTSLVDGWTCPADGLVMLRVIANASATGYYIKDLQFDTSMAWAGIYDNTRYENTLCSTSTPVKKGHIYQQSYFGGKSRSAYYFKLK